MRHPRRGARHQHFQNEIFEEVREDWVSKEQDPSAVSRARVCLWASLISPHPHGHSSGTTTQLGNTYHPRHGDMLGAPAGPAHTLEAQRPAGDRLCGRLLRGLFSQWVRVREQEASSSLSFAASHPAGLRESCFPPAASAPWQRAVRLQEGRPAAPAFVRCWTPSLLSSHGEDDILPQILHLFYLQ